MDDHYLPHPITEIYIDKIETSKQTFGGEKKEAIQLRIAYLREFIANGLCMGCIDRAFATIENLEGQL